MSLTTPPQPPADDPLTKIAAVLVVAIPLINKVWGMFPAVKRKRKSKHDTDEHLALNIIRDKDVEIKDLERRLDLRDAEVVLLEKRVRDLEPCANEVLTVRATYESLTNRAAKAEGELKTANALILSLRAQLAAQNKDED